VFALRFKPDDEVEINDPTPKGIFANGSVVSRARIGAFAGWTGVGAFGVFGDKKPMTKSLIE
jgi:hypothetical protein